MRLHRADGSQQCCDSSEWVAELISGYHRRSRSLVSAAMRAESCDVMRLPPTFASFQTHTGPGRGFGACRKISPTTRMIESEFVVDHSTLGMKKSAVTDPHGNVECTQSSAFPTSKINRLDCRLGTVSFTICRYLKMSPSSIFHMTERLNPSVCRGPFLPGN